MYRLSCKRSHGGCRAVPKARATNGSSSSTTPSPELDPVVTTKSVECVGEGQSVSCSVTETSAAEATSLEQAQEGEEGGLVAAIVATLLLVSPFFFWGTSMVAMKIAGPHSTPLFTASVRLIPAGILVVLWAASRARASPSSAKAWLAIALFGFVDGTLFQGFLAEGLQQVPAGIGSVLIDSQPLTVAVVAALFFGESLSAVGIAGLALGLFGLMLLEVPVDTLSSWAHLDFGSGSLDSVPWWENGPLLMLFAAQAMAAGTLMIPWITRFVDPVMATGWHMVLGGVPLVATSLATESDVLAEHLSQLTAGDVGALVYTSLLGGAAAYGVFFYNASKGNLTKLSSLTFLTPMFATFAGYLVLDERLAPLQIAGATVTLTGVLLMNYKPEAQSE